MSEWTEEDIEGIKRATRIMADQLGENEEWVERVVQRMIDLREESKVEDETDDT